MDCDQGCTNSKLKTQKLKTQNSKLETQNSKTQNSELKTQNSKTQNSIFTNSKLKTQFAADQTPLKLKTQNTPNSKLSSNSKLNFSKLKTQFSKLKTQNSIEFDPALIGLQVGVSGRISPFWGKCGKFPHFAEAVGKSYPILRNQKNTG